MRDQRQLFQRQQVRQQQRFFMPNCSCCPTGPCTGCNTTVINDDFSSYSGYSESSCGFFKNFNVSGGFLLDDYNSGGGYNSCIGQAYRAVTIPALNGLCITVSADCYDIAGKVSGVTGVGIGNVARLFAQMAGGSYIAHNKSDSVLCVGTSPTVHSWGTVVSGSRLTLCLQDTSSGGGTYSIKSYVNGVLGDSFTGQSISLTPGSTLNVGVLDTNGGKWANLSIATS